MSRLPDAGFTLHHETVPYGGVVLFTEEYDAMVRVWSDKCEGGWKLCQTSAAKLTQFLPPPPKNVSLPPLPPLQIERYMASTIAIARASCQVHIMVASQETLASGLFITPDCFVTTLRGFKKKKHPTTTNSPLLLLILTQIVSG